MSQFQYGCTEPPSPAKHYRLGVLLFTPTTIKLHVLILGRKLRLHIHDEDLGQSFRILNRFSLMRYAYLLHAEPILSLSWNYSKMAAIPIPRAQTSMLSTSVRYSSLTVIS